MKLFIVESPKKIDTICKALGKTYFGLSSYGHIMDLDKSKMSIDFENNFEPIYVINDDKKKVVDALKKGAKRAKEVLIATDKDREGEMIAWNIAHVLKLQNYKRIVFTSVTKKALEDAIKDADKINENIVNSQKARRILDRLVGYELSPLLDSFMDSHNLSAGRVQSVVARLIVDREKEISKFFSGNLNSYFLVKGVFIVEEQLLKCQLYIKKGLLTSKPFKGDISKILLKEEVTELLKQMIGSIYKIENVFDKKRMQSPQNPYTTSTLQQDGSTKLSFNGKRTMRAAQNLYEAGLITYMRTDAIILSEEALNKIEKYVLATYGPKYYKKTIYGSKEGAQEAHEAIRPTDINVIEAEEYGKIGRDEIRLYNLIWKRTVASQMACAQFNDLNVQISISKLNKYYFATSIATLVFDGFLILYKNVEDEKGENDKFNVKLLVEGTILKANSVQAIQEFDKPPSRYSEASLLKKLRYKEFKHW